MANKSQSSKRYNLVIPKEIAVQLEQVASSHRLTPVETIHKFIRLGLLAAEFEERDDAALIVRKNGVDREVMLV